MQTETAQTDYRQRQAVMQAAMQKLGHRAVVLEPGPIMLHLSGVRWGRSERTFAMVLPAKGDPVWVLPGFEEMRARELIRPGDEIRIWQEDESPYERIVAALRDRGITAGKVAIGPDVRFFVFDGIRKLAPELQYVRASLPVQAQG
jgi:Xaa-Pro dipeptidase